MELVGGGCGGGDDGEEDTKNNFSAPEATAVTTEEVRRDYSASVGLLSKFGKQLKTTSTNQIATDPVTRLFLKLL